MNFDIKKRLTKNALQVLEKTRKVSGNSDLKKINALFLLKALSSQKGSLGKTILETVSINPKKFLTNQQIKNKKIRVNVYEVVIKAHQTAKTSQTPFVGTEHLFHALLSLLSRKEKILLHKYFPTDKHFVPPQKTKMSKNNGGRSGRGFQTPDFMGDMNSLIENFFPSENKQKKSYLSEFGTDFNQLAKKQKHILIGREKELNRISNILGRKNKNNPVLIGDPGVGKTAIIEGLAQQINEGNAPFYLNNKKIIGLDLGLLVAGTNFRGEFEARLKEVVREASQNPEIILFIDEIHNLVGAGNAIGGMDAANILKPALSRGEIQVIGATTIEEYRKNIEKDAALERRFQSIYVEEPGLQEAKKILQGIKPLYEKHHNIKINPDAVRVAATLAKRYLHDKFLPDSAIDLIDESAAKKRTSSSGLELYKKINKEYEALDKIIRRKEFLVMNDRYEEAIRIRGEEKKKQDAIDTLKTEIKKEEKKNPVKLTAEDIKETVAEASQIPLSMIREKDSDIPRQIKSNLQKKLIGQKEVVEKIYQSVLRKSSGVADPNKPLGSFLFVGSSGVGKTMTAKILSQTISSSEKEGLIQINMSEFMERHSVSRLLGAPAGYVGYEESGELTEKIRRNPHSVVLFDEIEKADKNVLNVLLQILDEGEITDSKGKKINFKNAVIILTSNLGTNELNRFSSIGFGKEDRSSTRQEKNKAQKIIQQALQEFLPIELINRLDSVLIFNQLTRQDIKKIVKNEISLLKARLRGKGIRLNVQEDVLEELTRKSFDSKQGARLIKKQIEESVEPLLAEKIVSCQPKKIELTRKNNRLAIKCN
ncbi:MAG: AAA family ATPase [Patescibacteria group bacterium]